MENECMTEQQFGWHLSVLNVFSLSGREQLEKWQCVEWQWAICHSSHTHTPWHRHRDIITLGVIFPLSVCNHSSSSLITGPKLLASLCSPWTYTPWISLRIYSLTICWQCLHRGFSWTSTPAVNLISRCASPWLRTLLRSPLISLKLAHDSSGFFVFFDKGVKEFYPQSTPYAVLIACLCEHNKGGK